MIENAKLLDKNIVITWKKINNQPDSILPIDFLLNYYPSNLEENINFKSNKV